MGCRGKALTDSFADAQAQAQAETPGVTFDDVEAEAPIETM